MKRFIFGLIIALTIIAAATSLMLPEDQALTSAVGAAGRHPVIDMVRMCTFPVRKMTAFGWKIAKRGLTFLDELERAEPLVIRTLTQSENNRKSQRLQDALNDFLKDMLDVTDDDGRRDRDREDRKENDRRLPIMDQQEREETT